MPEVKIGDIVVGRYQIERLIAQGGFGDVFLARRLDLNVYRALKVLRRDALGMGDRLYQECQDRFKIEAQLGVKLNHPNLIKAVDYGQDGEMQVLAMEYAPGGNLAERLSNNSPLSIKEAVQIATDIARGLAAMHAMDVVHRDLKPSNVLFDARGMAKISDLGLAQLPGGASLRSLNGSQMAGTWHPGTRAYMSPEQESSTEYLKSSSDVFALGVILFEMLTGRNVKNLKPGSRVSDLRSDVPAWLDDLLLNMLERDPAKRPGDGSEVLQALLSEMARRQSSTVVASPVQSPPKAPSAPRSSSRWGFIILASVLVLILAIGTIFLFNNLATNLPVQSASTAVDTPQFAAANDSVVEYVVSSANSMLQPLNGASKQNMVRDALSQHWSNWATVGNDISAALRVFGSQYNAADSQKSCLDTQLLSAAIQTPTDFGNLLNSAEARGLSPITEALFAAVGDFKSGQKKSVVLITDSGDTCSGDPCNWADTQYRDAGLSMPIYVLDLGGSSGLECLSSLSGGQYFAIQNQSELGNALTLSIKR